MKMRLNLLAWLRKKDNHRKLTASITGSIVLHLLVREKPMKQSVQTNTSLKGRQPCRSKSTRNIRLNSRKGNKIEEAKCRSCLDRLIFQVVSSCPTWPTSTKWMSLLSLVRQPKFKTLISKLCSRSKNTTGKLRTNNRKETCRQIWKFQNSPSNKVYNENSVTKHLI